MHVPLTTGARGPGPGLLVAVALAATLGAAPGVVAATAAAGADAHLQQRLEVACARVPNALGRTQALQARLDADARTRGSLLWLEAAAGRARENGRDDLATTLGDRLRVRRELADLLPQRLVRLDEAQASCTAAGL